LMIPSSDNQNILNNTTNKPIKAAPKPMNFMLLNS
jgi:hypothetical protein